MQEMYVPILSKGSHLLRITVMFSSFLLVSLLRESRVDRVCSIWLGGLGGDTATGSQGLFLRCQQIKPAC